MTYSENNASESEISINENLLNKTILLNTINFYSEYLILDNLERPNVESPFDGFINILFSGDKNSCICPYFINQNSYLIKAGENIIHRTKKRDIFEWKNINKNNIAILIYIPMESVLNFLLPLKKNIDRFKSGLMTKSDSRIILSVNQIIDLNNQNDPLLKLKIQSLIIDLLVHQIEGLFAENENQELIVNKNHYEKIVLARSIIDKDLTQNHTIPELAKLVGTNEQYLKTYFKQYFGKTIMNYITEQKMNHAKELMMTGQYRVSDVARLTGYKHSTHFTTAFKKYFGFIPNSLRYTFLMANEGSQQILNEIENIIRIL